MDAGKALLVLLLLVGIIVGANLAMFLAVRGAQNMHFDWRSLDLTKLSQKENDKLEELNRRVQELQDHEKGEEPDQE